METNIVLTSVPLQDLLTSFRQIIKEEIKAEQSDALQEKLLTTAEVCDLFKVSKVTIGAWTDQGQLIRYSIGGRNYFKYSEIMESLKTLKKYKAK